ncbi:MAG: hypothetical protein JRL30_21015 [Deltaproteobacteria bacterium]|nr:hypothetical protein [Deltaproteobacteria bacterium]
MKGYQRALVRIVILAVVIDRKTGKVFNALCVSSLNEVNYDITLGDDMIVFSRSAWGNTTTGSMGEISG